MVQSEIHHIALNVSDVKEAKEFYSRFFSLHEIQKPSDRPNSGAWLEATDGRQIHLRKGKVPEDNGQHLAFLVTDIHKTCQILLTAEVHVTSPVAIGTSLQAFLHDPAGNRIEIHQLGGSNADA
ncbi:MAG: VOC family protein [Acidimicrobiales bacterium]|jgi:catechol 2,3-dioxygenase-like lactoylglutathione lyase family enzyme|nr:VOC family protein [Acidimicrobiales bacterium]MDP6299305.1 VOC family protein [Acidimicrobiales bacterium]HJM28291.1 VOC family protein [Acidimicrobiales bacterium]HJM96871.1 VOC family protein [Acidimicrobiales bacterium]